MPTAIRRICCSLFLLFPLATTLLAQSTEAEIKARLMGKPLYLRGFWSDRELYYDAGGNLSKPSKSSSFTLNGFYFVSCKLKSGMLVLTGKPIGVEFLKDGPRRVELVDRKRTIQIDAPAKGDFGPALNAIFVDGLEALAPLLPVYWQTWAHKAYPAAYPANAVGDATKTNASDFVVANKARGPALPRLHKHSEAEFTEEARTLKYSGGALIQLIVGTDGRPSDVAILRPLGLGLDEQALASVAQYRFDPVIENGVAVPVEVDTEVSFQIF